MPIFGICKIFFNTQKGQVFPSAPTALVATPSVGRAPQRPQSLNTKPKTRLTPKI